MSEELKAAYEKYAPRWFKVIRWGEFIQRQKDKHLFYMSTIMLPVTMYFIANDISPYPQALIWYKPETDEERDYLKNKYIIARGNNPFVGRNWEIGQYHGQYPPMYDVWQRRKKYPQYYGDKYNTYARDAYCDTYVGGYP